MALDPDIQTVRLARWTPRAEQHEKIANSLTDHGTHLLEPAGSGRRLASDRFPRNDQRARRTISTVAFLTLLPFGQTTPEDCNGNGIEDQIDIAEGDALDCNLNGVPDDCDVAPTCVLSGARFVGAGRSPVHSTVADLDNDRDNEIVALRATDGIAVIDEIDSPFPVVVQTLEGGRDFVVAADFNGDGWTDIASVGPDFAVSYNSGSGTLNEPVRFPAHENARTIATGDMDADGDIDAAVGIGFREEAINLYWNDDGSFNVQRLDMGGSLVKLVDLDQDGQMDLVSTGENNTSILLHANRGDGRFDVQIYETSAITDLVAVDLAGDSPPEIAWLIEAEAAVFVASQSSIGRPSRIPTSEGAALVAADFDGDARADLAIHAGLLQILRNESTGNTGVLRPGETIPFGTGAALAGTLVAFDLDGDRFADVLSLHASHGLALLVDPALDTKPHERRVFIGLGGSAGRAVAKDFNGDGFVDLAVPWSISSRQLTILLGASDGAFLQRRDFTLGDRDGAIAALDLELDGDWDLVTDRGSVWSNDGTAAFQQSTTIPPSSSSAGVAIVDIDGDGYHDVVQGLAQGGLSLRRNLQGLSFSDAETVSFSAEISAFVVADVDGDDDFDAAAAMSEEGLVAVRLNLGDWVFGEESTYAIGRSALDIVAADLDEDGFADLAVSNLGSSDVTVLRNDGSGGFASRMTYPIGGEAAALAVVDVDCDGRSDLAVVAGGSDYIHVLRNAGDGSFQNAAAIPAVEPIAIAAADVDLDGLSDLIVTGGSRQVIASIIPTARTVENDCDRDGIPDECEADCDGDGEPDDCEIAAGDADDDDGDGRPDECADALQRIGDCNQNGDLEIADGHCILGYLFSGDPPRLPCGDGTAHGEGTRALLDWNGSGIIDISDGISIFLYIFLSGDLPVLALGGEETSCVRISDCEETLCVSE